MSEWITDREPTADDAPMDHIIVWSDRWNVPVIIDYGDWNKQYPWMPIPNPEPYVAPKSKSTSKCSVWHEPFDFDKKYEWYVLCNGTRLADNIPTREAAERIAAIYNEVMP